MLPKTLEMETSLEERLSEVGKSILDWAKNLENFERRDPINPKHNKGNIIERFSQINPTELTDEQKDIFEKISGTNPNNVIVRDPDQIREQAKKFFPAEDKEK